MPSQLWTHVISLSASFTVQALSSEASAVLTCYLTLINFSKSSRWRGSSTNFKLYSSGTLMTLMARPADYAWLTSPHNSMLLPMASLISRGRAMSRATSPLRFNLIPAYPLSTKALAVSANEEGTAAVQKRGIDPRGGRIKFSR
jgi:hypothetical protein